MRRRRCQFVMRTVVSLTPEILEPRRRSAAVGKYRPSALSIERQLSIVECAGYFAAFIYASNNPDGVGPSSRTSVRDANSGNSFCNSSAE